MSGVLVPPGDPSALAAAIDRMRTDGAFSQALAMRGRDVARERFSLPAMCAGVAQVLAEL